MGAIISIINNKGGCGKTTTTCNLAAALGKAGKKVLVVDIDSQCNTSEKLVPNRAKLNGSLYDILSAESIGDEDFKRAVCLTESKNVSIIPNIDTTASLEPGLITNAPDSLFRLKNNLRTHAQNYDITIIDNPPNIGTFVLCSLYASDFAIVPIKSGSTDSVEGLNRALALIKEINAEYNEDLKLFRILINCVDKRTAINKAVIEQVRDAFGNGVFNTMIPINTAFEQAESLQETVFQTDGTSSGARAFRSLAKEVISLLD